MKARARHIHDAKPVLAVRVSTRWAFAQVLSDSRTLGIGVWALAVVVASPKKRRHVLLDAVGESLLRAAHVPLSTEALRLVYQYPIVKLAKMLLQDS